MNFGIIADGNRRWAKKYGFTSEEGHKKGFAAVKDEIFPTLYNNPDFNAMTVYAFSTENWKRSVSEVKYLMKLYETMIDEWLPELLKKNVKLVHCGRKTRIPASLKKKIEQAEEQTKKGKGFTIHLCLDYGGRDEIIRAAKKGNIEKNLEVSELDIVLRTGGEQRLSNFCIWQAAYAEFFFIKKFLPQIKKTDVRKIIETFTNRDRRKGN